MKFVELCVFDAKAPPHLRRPSGPPGAPGKGNPSGPKGDRAAAAAADGGPPAVPAAAAAAPRNGLAEKAAAAAAAAAGLGGSRPGKPAAEKRESGEGRDTAEGALRGRSGEEDVGVVAAVDLHVRYVSLVHLISWQKRFNCDYLYFVFGQKKITIRSASLCAKGRYGQTLL